MILNLLSFSGIVRNNKHRKVSKSDCFGYRGKFISYSKWGKWVQGWNSVGVYTEELFFEIFTHVIHKFENISKFASRMVLIISNRFQASRFITHTKK